MTWLTSERSPAKKARNGIAYEVHWRDGVRKMQRTFTVKREAERFALKVETAERRRGHDALSSRTPRPSRRWWLRQWRPRSPG